MRGDAEGKHEDSKPWRGRKRGGSEKRHLETGGPKPRTLHPNSQIYNHHHHQWAVLSSAITFPVPFWANVTDKATDPHMCSAPAFDPPLPPVRGGVGGDRAGNGAGRGGTANLSLDWLGERREKRGRKEQLTLTELF